MNILLIGDVFGSAGIKAIKNELTEIKKKYAIDFTIANAENTSSCRGLTLYDYQLLKKLGIDFFTMGNHTWKQNDIDKVLKQNDVIHPANVEGENISLNNGYRIINVKNKSIKIINLMGNLPYFRIGNITNPFITMKKILTTSPKTDITILDFHAETTSEKNCMLHAFCKEVQIIVGTHTHVQTNDAQIYNDTAYITDLGMTGPREGIIGADKKELMQMFFGKKDKFKLTEAEGKYQFCAVVVHIDDQTNIATKIQNIYINEQ